MNQVIESFYMSSSVRIRLIILRCVIYLYCLSSWFTRSVRKQSGSLVNYLTKYTFRYFFPNFLT
nr:MAG TPA: hypothetical protein [Caudoviricetes sp.]